MTRKIPSSIGTRFQEIYKLAKTLNDCSIMVEGLTKGINGCLLAKSDVHFSAKDNGECAVIVMVQDKGRHWFHLHHPAHATACFRYDAAGHVHMNPHSVDRALAARKVPSPHFHKFTPDGLEYAYRTDVIEKQEQALNDPSLAFHAFCTEGKISCKSKANPALHFKQSLFPEEETIDPLEGHHFP